MFDKLSAPFSPDKISWRLGSTNREKTRGMALAYIDARDVMDRLDAVCGPGGWQCDYPHANGKTVCRIGIKINDEWVWKADGAGDTDVEAEKGALSDAFKRAAVRWGIGRYLYDLGSPWVEIEQSGKSYTIKDSEKNKLAKSLAGNTKSVVNEPQKVVVTTKSSEPAVATQAIEWGRIFKACQATTEIIDIQYSQEFKEFWKGANAADRKHVSDIAEKRKAALMANYDRADTLSPQDALLAG